MYGMDLDARDLNFSQGYSFKKNRVHKFANVLERVIPA